VSEDRPAAGVVVRPAVADDAAAIARVHVESWRAAYPGIVPQDVLDNLSIERRAGFWAGLLADPGEARTWVAEREGAVVGFAGTNTREESEAAELPAGSVELTMLYVLAKAWGAGIGRGLLAAAVALHAARRAPLLSLWVFEANDRARRFYERAGWLADGAARHLPIGNAQLPIVRYRLDLRPGLGRKSGAG
jgi:GNAT superfamily N-acetyltransferase